MHRMRRRQLRRETCNEARVVWEFSRRYNFYEWNLGRVLSHFVSSDLGNFILFDTTLNLKQAENLFPDKHKDCLPKSEQFWLLTSLRSLLRWKHLIRNICPRVWQKFFIPFSFPIIHSDMVMEWPRRRAQTQAAMKKERPLEEKVLADVRKRVSQIEKMLKPALDNSSVSSNTTKEAERTAHAVAKVCVQSVAAMMTAFPSASAVLCVQNCSVLLCRYSKYLPILCCHSSSLSFIFPPLFMRRNPKPFWLRPSTPGPHPLTSAPMSTPLYNSWLSRRCWLTRQTPRSPQR